MVPKKKEKPATEGKRQARGEPQQNENPATPPGRASNERKNCDQGREDLST